MKWLVVCDASDIMGLMKTQYNIIEEGYIPVNHSKKCSPGPI